MAIDLEVTCGSHKEGNANNGDHSDLEGAVVDLPFHTLYLLQSRELGFFRSPVLRPGTAFLISKRDP